MGPLKSSARLLILAVAAVASFFAAEQWLQPTQATPDQLVGPAPRPNTPVTLATNPATTSTPATAAPERDPSLMAPQRQRAIPDSAGEAFAPVSWLPPPPKAAPVPPPPPPPAPPPPTAPPLPFTFVGLLEQGLGVTQPKAFLAKGELLLVVAAGDTLETNYSVDSITAQQITLTYLPLKQKQTLNVSGAPR